MIEKLSNKHQDYCAIKFMLDMKQTFSKFFVNDENAKVALTLMLGRLSSDLELSKDEILHLVELLGI
tara:strand:+ start:1065 stop:1265 length:201 start_codon:yes stop_codon:yes gene_type:complete